GEDRDQVGDRAVADEPLRAGDEVVVAVANGGRADPGAVGARLCLGQRERDELPAGGEVRDPAGLLLGRAGEDERQRSELVDRRDEPGGGTGGAQLLDSPTQAPHTPPP